MNTSEFRSTDLQHQEATRHVWGLLIQSTQEKPVSWSSLQKEWKGDAAALLDVVNSVIRPIGVVSGNDGGFWIGLP